jgi:RecA/RadA recombinase
MVLLSYAYHLLSDTRRPVCLDLILPSGVNSLDRLLNGGLLTGLITHVYGEAGAGKTTFALQFVRAACRLGVRTTYMNTEGSSPIERLEQISEKDFSEIEDLVRIIMPKSFEEQGAIIDDLELYARENTRLLVIDTLTRLYRVVLEDRKTTYVAHRELNRQAGFLKGLANTKDIAVVVLNQVRGRVNGSTDFEPVAKNIMDYWSDYVVRIRTKRGMGERLIERIRPEIDLSNAVLYLTNNGFSNEPTHEKE